MITRSNAILTAAQAIAAAEEAGIRAAVMCAPELIEHAFSVALTTLDSDPSLALHIRDGRHGRDVLLLNRDQSGPERWDYPASIEEASSRWFVRLSVKERSVDVPFLSATAALVLQRDWSDPPTVGAPAVLLREQFDEAISRLVAVGTGSV